MITHGNVLSFVQLSPLIDSSEVHEIGYGSNWTTTIASYLKDGILQNEKEAARKINVRATRFVLIKDVLYKRGFSRPYLRCLDNEEADYVMREVHEGICRNTQDQGRWYTSSYERDTIGLPCRQTPKPMLGPATNVRGSATLLGNQPKS